MVTQLAKYLRSLNALPLASRTQYQRVLKDFSEHCRQSGKKEEEPVEQVPEEAKEQTPAVQPKVYPYGVREVMELADVAEYRDAACLTWLYQELRGGPLTEELVRRELMADPGSEGRAKYALSSEGVLHLASMVIQRERRLGHLPPAPNEEPEEPEQEPEPSPAPKPAPEPRKEPLSPGEAAVALAKDAGVPLPWCADEPLRVDVARLLVLLAERL